MGATTASPIPWHVCVSVCVSVCCACVCCCVCVLLCVCAATVCACVLLLCAAVVYDLLVVFLWYSTALVACGLIRTDWMHLGPRCTCRWSICVAVATHINTHMMHKLHLVVPWCFVRLLPLYFVLLACLGSGTSGWPTPVWVGPHRYWAKPDLVTPLRVYCLLYSPFSPADLCCLCLGVRTWGPPPLSSS
jgi:hypothetical protein